MVGARNGDEWIRPSPSRNRYGSLAGGDFTTAGGVPANYIAKWDGTSWSALGNGMNNAVLALAVIGTDIFAGGHFTIAGGDSANFVARWGCQTVTDVEENKSIPEKFELLQSYPNPFNPTTIIRFKIAESGFTTLRCTMS